MRTTGYVELVNALILAALLFGAAGGWLGSLATCGADGAQVCVAWPGAASAATWLLFVGVIAVLVLAQSREWHGDSVARRELALLLAILGVALLERLWRPDQADMGYDEASAASLVAAWRLDGLFPLTGIVSSVGIPNPPGWPYLLALVLLWFDSPYAVVALGITTSMLALVLIWWIGRRWIGSWGALGATCFYAGSFWATFLGRGGWQPVFLQVPVVLCLDALLLLAVRQKPWALLFASGWLALMVQLHYVALVFALMLPLAVWPARRVLRASHLLGAGLVALALWTPFLIFELNPATRLRDFSVLAGDIGGAGSHWDLEAWNLLWTLAGDRGVAGLGGPDSAGLSLALGRWSNLGLVGIPLVACGIVAAVLGWPRGWRGALLAAWTLTPAVGLAHHTLGVLFHYLYLGVPGMALVVGALVEWGAQSGRLALRATVGGGLAVYAAASAAMLWLVLEEVHETGVYPGAARPLGLNMAAAQVTRSFLTPGDHVFIGGPTWDVEMLRFGIGHDWRARIFDDCATPPLEQPAIYVLNSEDTVAASLLAASGAPLLARVPRPSDAFLVYGDPRVPLVAAVGCG